MEWWFPNYMTTTLCGVKFSAMIRFTILIEYNLGLSVKQQSSLGLLKYQRTFFVLVALQNVHLISNIILKIPIPNRDWKAHIVSWHMGYTNYSQLDEWIDWTNELCIKWTYEYFIFRTWITLNFFLCIRTNLHTTTRMNWWINYWLLNLVFW